MPRRAAASRVLRKGAGRAVPRRGPALAHKARAFKLPVTAAVYPRVRSVMVGLTALGPGAKRAYPCCRAGASFMQQFGGVSWELEIRRCIIARTAMRSTKSSWQRPRRKLAFGRSLAVTAALHFRHAKESSFSSISCCERPYIDKGGASAKSVAAIRPHDFYGAPLRVAGAASKLRYNSVQSAGASAAGARPLD
jgi:hypothetical protein